MTLSYVNKVIGDFETPVSIVLRRDEELRDTIREVQVKNTWSRLNLHWDTGTLHQGSRGGNKQHLQYDVETAVLPKEAGVSRRDHVIGTWARFHKTAVSLPCCLQ